MGRALLILGCLLAWLPVEAAAKERQSSVKIGDSEKRFLDLVSTLPYTTTYDELQKIVPELGPLKDQGYDNSEAMFETRLFGFPSSLHFSFNKRVLVSCGARIENLERAQAIAIYKAVRNYFRDKFGKGREHEGYGDDDPNADYSCFSNWTANGIDFGAGWKHHGKFQAGWGAQAAPKASP